MKKKSLLLYALLTLLLSSLLFSAKELPTKAELIQNEVAEKLAVFQQKEKEKCRQKVLERAEILVDSMLIARARLQVNGEVEKPEIPFRPGRPEVKLPKDSTPVAPIFPHGTFITTPKPDSIYTDGLPSPLLPTNKGSAPADSGKLLNKKRWDQ